MNASRRYFPSILSSNCRSVLPKLDEIRTLLFLRNIDIFVASESWLNDQHDDNTTSIEGYLCFRADRRNRIGGGVAIWSKYVFPVYRFPVSYHPDFECLIICFTTLHIALLALYIPPITSTRSRIYIDEFIISHLDNVLAAHPGYSVIICGDLNRFDVSVVCSSFNLVNLNILPTYGDSQLDYILIPEFLSDVYKITLCDPVDKSKTPHVSLLAQSNMEFRNDMSITKKVYDLRASYIQDFVSYTALIDWSFIENEDITLDNKCFTFHSILNNGLNAFIPVSYIRCSARDKPWITNIVKDLINKRWYAYRQRNFPLYNHLKVKVKNEINKAKMIWIKKQSAKDLWNAVNTVRGVNVSSNPLMSLLSQYSSLEAGVNDINNHLSSIFSISSMDDVHLPDNSDWEVSLTVDDIVRLLESISSRKASADLPSILYKSACTFLAPPLFRLISESLSTRKVPRIWKCVAVSPIPKTSNPSIDDIRPISLLKTPAKLLEKVVLSSVKPMLLEHYGRHQFGFRQDSSTLCALVSLDNYLKSSLDNPETDGAIMLAYDYSKAFDTLKKEHIIKQLIRSHFPPGFIHWITNYLSDRKQFVQIGSTSSFMTDVTSGIPQGSILGPFLYCVATSSFGFDSSLCHLTKYADDTTLCMPIYKSGGNNHIQHFHGALVDWSQEMDLQINLSKCKSLTILKRHSNSFAINIPGIQRVESLNILGVHFNSRATWADHIDHIVKNSSRRFFAIRVLRPILSNEELKTIYFSFIRSLLEYCAPLFIGLSSTDSYRLHRLQKRFHRLLCGPDCELPCLPSLEDRRTLLSMRFLSNMMCRNHILNNLLPVVSHSGRFILPQRRTVKRSQSYILLACSIFNSLCQR